MIVANALVGIPLLCINVPIVVVCLAYVGWLSPAVLACGLVFAVLAIAASTSCWARGDAAAPARPGRAGRRWSATSATLIDGFRELKLHRGRREAFLDESPGAGRRGGPRPERRRR